MPVMSMDESEIAEKAVRALTERDPFDDGEAEVDFTRMSAGVLRVTCMARVRAADPCFKDLEGEYEVEIFVRRRR